MQINLKRIKKQFEKSLDSYDKNAVVQNIMAENLVSELVKYKNTFDKVLELGTGSGILAQKVVGSIEFNQYTGNDLVEKSQIYLKKYIKSATFMCGNALKIKPIKKYDLITSNAMFQWFQNFEKAIMVVKSNLNTNGILAFTTFSTDNYKQIKEISGLGLDYLTSSEIKTVLEKCGFEILHISEYRKDLEFKSPLELLNHIKHTGVNSLSIHKWSIKDVKDFCQNYLEKYDKVILTYAPVIVIARLKQL